MWIVRGVCIQISYRTENNQHTNDSIADFKVRVCGATDMDICVALAETLV